MNITIFSSPQQAGPPAPRLHVGGPVTPDPSTTADHSASTEPNRRRRRRRRRRGGVLGQASGSDLRTPDAAGRSRPQNTIGPDAIDDVPIDAIRGHHRKDLGDLAQLVWSISTNGLRHPIALTRDYELLDGERRLEACRRLGKHIVPARFVDNLEDAAKLLAAAREETFGRKEMLPSELASVGAVLEEVEAKHARARQGTRTDLGRELPGDASGMLSGEVRDAVGKALGISGRTYQYLHNAARIAGDETAPEEERKLARDALAEMDRENSVWRPGKRLGLDLRALREARRQQEQPTAEPEPLLAPPAAAAPVGGPVWTPAGNDRSPAAAQQRRLLIEEMAASGHSSEQMGQHLQINADTVRRIARAAGIRIPADEARGRGARKSIDSNRIVGETVQQVEGLMAGLELVNLDDLDPIEIPDWTDSLSKSLRVLNRLNKQLRERVQ